MRRRTLTLAGLVTLAGVCCRVSGGMCSPTPAAPGGEAKTATLAFAGIQAPSQVAAFAKFEITFNVQGSVAGNPQLPYSPAPPAGVDLRQERYQGISVDAEFSPDDWRTTYRQPAFVYQEYSVGGARANLQGGMLPWLHPTGNSVWKVRFAPNVAGRWQYRLTATDACGSGQTPPRAFNVQPSSGRGFVRVSRKDPRYFEFDDGGVFLSPGLQSSVQISDPPSLVAREFAALQSNRISFLRVWISSLYGAAWLRWRDSRNIHDGYLPRAGLLPFRDPGRSQDLMTLHLKYPPDWFGACYADSGGVALAVNPNASYLVSVRYWGEGIKGPRTLPGGRYGLVARISDPPQAGCSGEGAPVTGYGGNTSDWQTVQGVWNSGERNFLPRLSLSLENVVEGRAYVASASVRELLPDGGLGPEILEEHSMQYESYFPDRALRAMDDYLELAEKYGIYLKVVLMEKNDLIYYKLDDDGTFVIAGEPDNATGFYGLGRGLNKTRWLQRAWWRYVVARWGYSANIHSWELVNEGDTYLERHWQMADELGKFMRCEVFGVSAGAGDGAGCAFEHPNRHMVTTSFWAGFPGYSTATGQGFWGNRKYPNLDYADVHAYVATSHAPAADKAAMESDAAYYHLWHSKEFASWGLKFPVVRGEAALVPRGGSTDDYAGLGLQSDADGTWYRNFLWASLDSGALYEIYWYGIPHVYDPGRYDHRALSRRLQEFLEDVPLNNGHYQGLDAEVSADGLRVVGQKDVLNGRAHLWIQNKAHTWKNVTGGVRIAPVSACIRIGGFQPDRLYRLEWWDTHRKDGQAPSRTGTVAGSDGVLTVPVQNLISDVAVKVAPAVRSL